MTINRCISLLRPKLQAIATDFSQQLAFMYETGSTETNFEIYETLRVPERQLDFVRKGIAEPRSVETHPLVMGMGVSVLPFYNPLAAVAMGVNNGFNWTAVVEDDWRILRECARELGLRAFTKHLFVLPEWYDGLEPRSYEL